MGLQDEELWGWRVGTATHLSGMYLISLNWMRKNSRDGKFYGMCLLPRLKKMSEKGKVLAGHVGILWTLEDEREAVTSPSPAPSPRTHTLLEFRRKPCAGRRVYYILQAEHGELRWEGEAWFWAVDGSEGLIRPAGG